MPRAHGPDSAITCTLAGGRHPYLEHLETHRQTTLLSDRHHAVQDHCQLARQRNASLAGPCGLLVRPMVMAAGPDGVRGLTSHQRVALWSAPKVLQALPIRGPPGRAITSLRTCKSLSPPRLSYPAVAAAARTRQIPAMQWGGSLRLIVGFVPNRVAPPSLPGSNNQTSLLILDESWGSGQSEIARWCNRASSDRCRPSDDPKGLHLHLPYSRPTNPLACTTGRTGRTYTP